VSIDHPGDPEVNEGVGNTANAPDGNHSDSNSDDSDDNNDSDNSVSKNDTPLTTYVNVLEAKLDAELANLDSIYDPGDTNDESVDPNLSNAFESINQDEIQ
jgi:hypothetical protein